MKLLSLSLILVGMSLLSMAQQPLLSGNQIASRNGFLPNVGQVRDFENKPVDFVYYQANIGDQQVFITKYGLSVLFSRIKKRKKVPGKSADNKGSNTDSVLLATYELERVDITLKNASIDEKNCVVSKTDDSPILNLYYDTYKTSGEGLQLLHEVLIKNVYPGIDWKVYIKNEGTASTLKYDFVVRPGADPSLIKIAYSKNAEVRLENDGITAVSKMATLHEEKPHSYLADTKEIIDVQFNQSKNVVGFNIPPFDHSKTLIIDPAIFWTTFLGAVNNYVDRPLNMFGNDVESDQAGNSFTLISAYSTGEFPTLNPGNGAYYQNHTASPNGSMIISKFSRGGKMLWSTYFGNGYAGSKMTVDKYGNIHAMGRRLDGTAQFPNNAPAIPLLNGGGFFVSTQKANFISKFSNSGVLLSSSYFAGVDTFPQDMTYDDAGNIYITGVSTSYDFPIVDPGGGAYFLNQSQNIAAQILFISQFNSSNQLTWSTRILGNDYDLQARVCTDKLGNIYMAGQARSSNYPMVNAGGYFNPAAVGAVITRFNAARQMTWSTYFPSAFSIRDVTADTSGNVYVAADKRILKFDANTNLVFEKVVTNTKMYWWQCLQFDPVHNEVQALGIMNENYFGFPTKNTACNGSFFFNGQPPMTYNNATGPVFATLNKDGDFTYVSLADWAYEYYEYCEFTVDAFGDPIYMFGHIENSYYVPSPQMVDPGNGAYFQTICCVNTQANKQAALLMKLTASDLGATAQISASSGCCNGSATITTQCGQAPFTYVWSNGASTATAGNLCPGNYTVVVSDAAGLSTIIQVAIPYPPGSITSVSTDIIPENCSKKNGSVKIQSVQGGASPFSYSLDGNNYSVTTQFYGLQAGDTILYVKDGNGCIFKDTLSIGSLAGPTDITYSTAAASCMGNNGQITVTQVQGGVGPYAYAINNGIGNSTGVFTGLAASTYTLTVKDTAGCVATKSIVVQQATGPTNFTVNAGNDHCAGKTGFIKVNSITGGISPYIFSTDGINYVPDTLKNLIAGNYSVYVKDANGCVLSKGPIVISNISAPTSAVLDITHAFCGNRTGALKVSQVQNGVAPYSFSIDNGSYTTQNIFTGIAPGNYELQIKDAFGCIYSKQFAIQYTAPGTYNLLPADTTVCIDETVVLKLQGNVQSISNLVWNVAAGGLSAAVKATETKNVIVTFTDPQNCMVKKTAVVHAKACNPPERCLVVPKAFTPNKDGRNDQIGPITNGCRIRAVNFSIYNRLGEQVFQSSDLNQKWNGYVKGMPASPGAYVFTCTFITDDGVERYQSGSISLIR